MAKKFRIGNVYPLRKGLFLSVYVDDIKLAGKKQNINPMSEEEYFHYRQNWWISFNNSGNDTQPVRKRSDFNQALSTLNRLHQEAGGHQLETRNGDRHRVLPPPGGNGENPGGLPKNSKEVKKEEAGKGL